jgi:hypothetical protein
MQERLERWRKIIAEAKPKGQRWQPPKLLSSVKPKEPPQSAKALLDKSIKTLPDDEKEILQLRFVDGFSEQEIANAIGCKPLMVALIEQRALERLAEALKELQVDDETVVSWVAWWGEEKRKELKALVPEVIAPTSKCLSISRIYEASLQWDWTKSERNHIKTCAYCRNVFNKVSKQVWHPSSKQLLDYVVGSWLPEDDMMDIRYHLEEDKCKRCTFIVGILQPIATIQRVVAIATTTPVALKTAGFTGEEVKKVEVEEGDFKAELGYEPEGWVARAEALNVSAGSKVRFAWMTPEGIEKVKKEAELKRAFGGWYFAEEKLASPEEELGEGYFVAVLTSGD